MRPETVVLHVPYLEDERRFLLKALQTALAAHRALVKNRASSVTNRPALQAAHDGAVGGERCVELLRPQLNSSAEP